jgi:hypothetical protein
MYRDDHPSKAPAIADDGSMTLHVPSCVQQFSTRRRILSRLRALARRRCQGVPETEARPLKLQVEENPNWPLLDEGLAEAGVVVTAVEEMPGGEIEAPEMAADFDCSSAVGSSWTDLEIPLREAEAPEDTTAQVIERLREDNRDLKAALCRLIRISEQNHAALRLLEAENEDLSALVHRLSTGQVRASAAGVTVGSEAAPSGPRWLLTWSIEWFRRWQAR